VCSAEIEKRQVLKVKLIQGGRRVHNARVYYEVAVTDVEFGGGMGRYTEIWIGNRF
jgi:hypothetical protein